MKSCTGNCKMRLHKHFIAGDTERIEHLLATYPLVAELLQQATCADAEQLIDTLRSRKTRRTAIEALVADYNLAEREGIVMMSLAEAVIRTPDSATRTRLVRDKLANLDTPTPEGGLLRRASHWGLVLAGKVVDDLSESDAKITLGGMISRLGTPVVVKAVETAISALGQTFVIAPDIEKAIAIGREQDPNLRYSFDMLGEASMARSDAQQCYDDYIAAIETVGKARDPRHDIADAPSISVKVTAIHPRIETHKWEQLEKELLPRLIELCAIARDRGIGVCIDAEESFRLDVHMKLFHALYAAPELRGWGGLGLAIQAYQKRAPEVIDSVLAAVEEHGEAANVRLVKGAYWDTEIKRAQVLGLPESPVYRAKSATDLSYLVCAHKLLSGSERLFPAFASHNAHTLTTVSKLAKAASRQNFELQRLHGMGSDLHHILCEQGHKSRVYAPVGSYDRLLPYLVRRLLENGANSSFVNKVEDPSVPAGTLAASPLLQWQGIDKDKHQHHLTTTTIYSERPAAAGVDLTNPPDAVHASEMLSLQTPSLLAAPASQLLFSEGADLTRASTSPANLEHSFAEIPFYDSPTSVKAGVEAAMERLDRGITANQAVSPQARCEQLRKAADAFEAARDELVQMVVYEAGRTPANAIDEVREAVDFLRYYAHSAEKLRCDAITQPGPIGELNRWSVRPLGRFVTIAPWNFPVAIFIGQIAAALACGNQVVAKSAPQTPLTSMRCIGLLREAGIGEESLLHVAGGAALGKALVAHPSIRGVAFTGSTVVARDIAITLANRPGPITRLIAETGGLNACIADTTALPEQVVRDALRGAFDSAGQRCSSMRMLYVQEEAFDTISSMLGEAMHELCIGDPADLATDVGPLIDASAQAKAESYLQNTGAEVLSQTPMPANLAKGHWFAPTLLKVNSIADLGDEVFAPILHIAPYSDLEATLDAIEATGYGLTLALHTRIDATIDYVNERASAGNIYINRDQVGAVVESQPFGGHGLSGTGPKAGGPHYLHAFLNEFATCQDTTAVGGNATLFANES